MHKALTCFAQHAHAVIRATLITHTLRPALRPRAGLHDNTLQTPGLVSRSECPVKLRLQQQAKVVTKTAVFPLC